MKYLFTTCRSDNYLFHEKRIFKNTLVIGCRWGYKVTGCEWGYKVTVASGVIKSLVASGVIKSLLRVGL